MTDVLVVSGEAVWPPIHGGRMRTAGLVEALAGRLSVAVVAPAEGGPPSGIAFDALPPAAPVAAAATFARGPRVARALLGPARLAVLHEVVARRRPATVLFAPAYLAAAVPAFDAALALAVDFADVEARRMASLARVGPARARAVHLVEAVKARRWEPRLARRATVVTAATVADAAVLSSWGANPLLVPNGSSAIAAPRSPVDGAVTMVAGFGYLPNRDGARFLLDRVWPVVRRVEPRLRLRLVGRAAGTVPGVGSGIEIVSDPPSVDRSYGEAAVIVAPVRAGGGAQVKVTEALARARVVVTTPFSAAGNPDVVVADGPEEFAAALVRLWRDVGERHAREAALAAARPVPSWDEAGGPLVDALAGLVAAR